MAEIILVALTTFFATIGPLDIAAVFAALTVNDSPSERRQIALKGCLIGLCILLFFVVFGRVLLDYFGISLAALRTAGGVLLLLMAIDLVFARHSGANSTTDEENQEGLQKDDPSVFPLATPLIAGPGAIGAAILLAAEAQGDLIHLSLVTAAMLIIVFSTFVLMLMATQIQRVLGVTGLQVISRVVGVLLAALAVQFMFDGIAASGLLA